MEKMIGFHAMKSAIRGIRNMREKSKQKGNKVFHRFFTATKKGKETQHAFMVVNLDDTNKNEYFAISRI